MSLINKRENSANAILNLPGHQTIAAIAYHTNPRTIVIGRKEVVSAGNFYLNISDCNDRIRLDFDINEKEHRANTLRKVFILKEIISKLEEELTSAIVTRVALDEISSKEWKRKRAVKDPNWDVSAEAEEYERKRDAITEEVEKDLEELMKLNPNIKFYSEEEHED